jgi:hypothetical protein
MRSKWLVCCILSLLVFPHLLLGQEANEGETFLSRAATDRYGNSVLGGFSLLNPDKFSMAHSYTMSYSSSGGQGRTVGLYMNTMNYRFSEPLSVTLHVGYLHQPFGRSDSNSMFSNNAILSGFELTYRPKKNVFLKIEYGAVPVRYDPFSRYGSWYDW